jgi:hypothetical protein
VPHAPHKIRPSFPKNGSLSTDQWNQLQLVIYLNLPPPGGVKISVFSVRPRKKLPSPPAPISLSVLALVGRGEGGGGGGGGGNFCSFEGYEKNYPPAEGVNRGNQL